MVYFSKKAWDMLSKEQKKDFDRGISNIFEGILQLRDMGMPISKIVEVLEGELSEVFSKEDVMKELLKRGKNQS